MNTKQIVVFVILMQDDNGIESKSPDYITEKLAICSELTHPEQILDMHNQVVYKQWMQRWAKSEATS